MKIILVLLLLCTPVFSQDTEEVILPFKILQLTFSDKKDNPPKVPPQFLPGSPITMNLFVTGFSYNAYNEMAVTADLSVYLNSTRLSFKKNAFIMKKPFEKLVNIARLSCTVNPPILPEGSYRVTADAHDCISYKYNTYSTEFRISRNAQWILKDLPAPLKNASVCYSTDGVFHENQVTQIFFSGTKCIVLRLDTLSNSEAVTISWIFEKEPAPILVQKRKLSNKIEDFVMYSPHRLPAGQYRIQILTDSTSQIIEFHIISYKNYGEN